MCCKCYYICNKLYIIGIESVKEQEIFTQEILTQVPQKRCLKDDDDDTELPPKRGMCLTIHFYVRQ